MNLDDLFEKIHAATPVAPDIPEVIAKACDGSTVTPADAWAALDDDRIAVEAGQVTDDQLCAFVAALEASYQRQSGDRPDHYTQPATCAHCGPVWLWAGTPTHLTSCPWCERSEAGKDFERPGHATVEKL